jgi:hypothetical protein
MNQKNGMVNTFTIKGPTIGIKLIRVAKPMNTLVIYPSNNVIIVMARISN